MSDKKGPDMELRKAFVELQVRNTRFDEKKSEFFALTPFFRETI